MQPRKLSILSAFTAGSLALAAVVITASSGTSPTAKHAALAAQTESFPPVNLDDCPILYAGYPTGACVAQLQTDLNSIPGNDLDVDGTFGSQTYAAVIAFQQANGLPQDGIVGPATKQALDAALSVPTPTVPSATAPAPATPAYWPGAEKCVTPHQHCYSRAVDVHSDLIAASTAIQSTWFSMLDQTQAPYQTPVVDNGDCTNGTCPWFITREMWLGDPNHWIEIGLMDGYESPQWRMPNGAPGCGCQAYFQYWEDGDDRQGTEHVIANITPDNAWHTYGISRVSGDTFDLTIDGRVVGVSTASGASSFGVSAIGSETSGLTTVQPLSYMNQSCQSWSVQDTSGRWFGIGSPNQGVRGAYNNSGSPDRTYFGGWNDTTHQLCIGKGGL